MMYGMALICGGFSWGKTPANFHHGATGSRNIFLCVLSASARDSLAADEGGVSRGGAESAEACVTNGGNLLGKNACANFHHGLPSENLALRSLRLCEISVAVDGCVCIWGICENLFN